jgi:hypothetical protein
MRRPDPAKAAFLVAVIAGCGVSGAPVAACAESDPGDRAVAIVRATTPGEEERPLAIDCWRELDSERIELWFSYPDGSGCWQLSSLELRESADAISISLRASPAPICTVDPGTESLTQIELQAPLGDRDVLDASGG